VALVRRIGSLDSQIFNFLEVDLGFLLAGPPGPHYPSRRQRKPKWRPMNKRRSGTMDILKYIELNGGWDRVIEIASAQQKRLDRLWNRQADPIGRILKAHLIVEHCLTAHLLAHNPNLGGLDKARLSYDQKLNLLDPKIVNVHDALPGLRLLGTIRNRFSHRLEATVTKADADALFAIELFRALYLNENMASAAKEPDDETERVLEIIERFAAYIAIMLDHLADPQLKFHAPGGLTDNDYDSRHPDPSSRG